MIILQNVSYLATITWWDVAYRNYSSKKHHKAYFGTWATYGPVRPVVCQIWKQINKFLWCAVVFYLKKKNIPYYYKWISDVMVTFILNCLLLHYFPLWPPAKYINVHQYLQNILLITNSNNFLLLITNINFSLPIAAYQMYNWSLFTILENEYWAEIKFKFF